VFRACAADNKVAIAAAGAVTPLVALLGVPAEDVRAKAAGALWNLAVNSESTRSSCSGASSFRVFFTVSCLLLLVERRTVARGCGVAAQVL
jgi:hypothetical protein